MNIHGRSPSRCSILRSSGVNAVPLLKCGFIKIEAGSMCCFSTSLAGANRSATICSASGKWFGLWRESDLNLGKTGVPESISGMLWRSVEKRRRELSEFRVRLNESKRRESRAGCKLSADLGAQREIFCTGNMRNGVAWSGLRGPIHVVPLRPITNKQFYEWHQIFSITIFYIFCDWWFSIFSSCCIYVPIHSSK